MPVPEIVIGSLRKRRFWQHGRREVKKQNCDGLKTWSLLPVNVRVVKNVVFLSSLIPCEGREINSIVLSVTWKDLETNFKQFLTYYNFLSVTTIYSFLFFLFQLANKNSLISADVLRWMRNGPWKYHFVLKTELIMAEMKFAEFQS